LHPARPATPQIRDPALALTFPDLKSRPTSVTGFRGDLTPVLFWNPGCGCWARMLDDLKTWEADPIDDAPKLLVVSRGDVEANRAMGLRSPVVLDPRTRRPRSQPRTTT
jgi:hypothetical protein